MIDKMEEIKYENVRTNKLLTEISREFKSLNKRLVNSDNYKEAS